MKNSSLSPLDQSPLSGVLVVDKPRGLTSAQVVAAVKRITRARRVGHTGTLDPLATGVLPICIGGATKLAAHLLTGDKEYEAELVLGVETDTLDADGQVTRVREEAARAVTAARLQQAAGVLTGPSEQVPPMYSALKQRGRRLYELARAGQTVARKPRPITVYRFDVLAFDPPRARVRISCSKGTYVRVLVADVGEALGCGAHVTALRRTRAGAFGERQAVPLAEVDADRAAAALLRPAVAVAHLPGQVVPDALESAVQNGIRLKWQEVAGGGEPPRGTLRLLSSGGELLALAQVEDGITRYERVLCSGLTKRADSSKLPRSKP